MADTALWQPPAGFEEIKPAGSDVPAGFEEVTGDELIAYSDPKKVLAYSKAAEAYRPDLGGIGEHAAAATIPPEDRHLFKQILAKQYATDPAMQKAGFGTRLTASAVQGAVDFAMPAAKLVGAVPALDPEQERFKQELLGIRQGLDPTIRPDTPVAGRWLQQAAQMGTPMVMAAGAGKLAGATAAAAGAGATGVGVATALGTSGSVLPQMADKTYTELIAEGVDPSTAMKITAVSAPIEAAIEAIIPDPLSPFAAGVKGTIRQVAGNILKEATKNYTKELAEEGLQGVVSETALEVGRQLDEQIPNQGIGNILMQGVNSMVESAGPLAILMGPGAVVGAAQTAQESAARKQRLEQLQALRTVDGRDLKREAAKLGIEGSRSQIRQKVNEESKQIQKEIKRAQAVPPEETEVRQEPVEQAPSEEAPREQVQPPVAEPSSPSQGTERPVTQDVQEPVPVNQDRVEEIIDERFGGRTEHAAQDVVREDLARAQAKREAAAAPQPVPETPPINEDRVDQLFKDNNWPRRAGNKDADARREASIRQRVSQEQDLVRQYPPGTVLGMEGYKETFTVMENGRLMASSGRWMGSAPGSALWDHLNIWRGGDISPRRGAKVTVISSPAPAAPEAQGGDIVTPPTEAAPEPVPMSPRELAQQKQSPAEPFQMPADEIPAAKEAAAIRKANKQKNKGLKVQPEAAPQAPIQPPEAAPAKREPAKNDSELARNIKDRVNEAGFYARDSASGRRDSFYVKVYKSKEAYENDYAPLVEVRVSNHAPSDFRIDDRHTEQIFAQHGRDAEDDLLQRAIDAASKRQEKRDSATASTQPQNASEPLPAPESTQPVPTPPEAAGKPEQASKKKRSAKKPKPASPEQTSGETDIYRNRGRKSLRTNETSPGETDTVSESRPPQGSGEDSEAAGTVSETPTTEKPAEAPMTQWETEEADRLRGARQDARVKGVSNRYWKEQRKRAEKFKGTRGKVSVSIVEEVADEKDAKKKAKKDRREDRPATILTDKWAITEWEDSGKKSFSLTHTPSGLRVAEYDKITDARALYGFMREVGVDLDAIPDTGELPDGVVRDGKAAIAAYDHSDLGRLTPEQRERAVGMVETTKTDVAADLILDAYDLGVFGGTRMRDESPRLKKLAKEVPEFAYNPVFTVDADKKLVFQDGHKFRFDPGAFNLHPSELKVGQTVGINLDDLGVKRPKPEDVVKNVLSREFEVKKQGKTGTLTLTPLGGDGTSFTVSGSGEDWSVASRGNSVAGKRAQQLLDGIPWTRKEQIAKNEAAAEGKTKKQQAADAALADAHAEADEGEGTASLAAPNPTRQTRSYRRKVEGDKAGIAAADIQKTAQRLFGVAIRHGGFSHRAAGIYKWLSGRSGPPSPEVVRTAEGHYASVGVIAHEIAHHIDEKTKAVRSMPKDVRQEIKGLDYEPQKARAFEGWAEFLRRYMTEPSIDLNGKQVPHPALEAPQTLAWFEGTFLLANPEVAKAIAQFREYAQQFAQQTVFQRLGTLITDRQPRDLSFKDEWLAKHRRVVERTVIDHQNKFAMLKWIQDEARSRGHKGIGIYDLTMTHFLSASSHFTKAAEEGVSSIREFGGSRGGTIGKTSLWGLREFLESDSEREDANLYALARFTVFMAEKKPGYNTGMDIDDAEAWLAEVEERGQTDRFEGYAQGIARFANDLLKMLVDAGALPAKQAENMLRYYEGGHYFPLYRVREGQLGMFTGTGSGFVNLGKAVQGRSQKGSGRQIIDPIDALVQMGIKFYGRAIQARQAHVLAETLDPKLGGVGGMGGIMDRVDPKRKVTQGTLLEILDQLVEAGEMDADRAKEIRIASQLLNPEESGMPSEKSIEWFAQQQGIEPNENGEYDLQSLVDAAEQLPDALAEISLWRPDFTPNASKRTVVIYDKQGKPLMYELDPQLYATANGMDELTFGFWTNLLRSSARWFKTGAVSASTGFGLRNLIRDYIEFQGKAQYVKGTKTLTRPPQMLVKYGLKKLAAPVGAAGEIIGKHSQDTLVEGLGQYIAEKAKRWAGNKANDPLIRLYEELGSKIYSPIGHQVHSRRKYRQRRMGKSVMSKLGLAVKHPLDSAESVLQAIMDVIAISDAPPRLAEMEAAIQEEGYEVRDGGWFDVKNGEAVDHLPEHVVIKAGMAAAEATVNFKAIGAKGQYLEAFAPFSNAAVQALARQYRQVKGLKSLGTKDADGSRAARYVVYLSALAATSAVYWMLRHDDDDWREMEPWLREGFWTWGKNGNTYLTVPKPRDSAIVANLVENLLDVMYHDDARNTSDVVLRDLGGRLPTGGGALRGGIEAFVADYDYFRGKPLTPDDVKRKPRDLQVTSETSRASDAIGKVLGKYGIGPIQVQHVLNSASGGVYGRMTDLYDAAKDGRLGPEHLPVLRGLFMDRHQAASVSTFYEENQTLHDTAEREKAETGKVSDDTTRKQGVFESHAELMASLRSMEGKIGKKRDYQLQPYIVGLARAALGYDELPHNPNPLTAKDAPEDVRKLVQDYSQRVVVAATEPLKEKSAYKDEESYEKERRARVRGAAKLKAIGMSYEESARLLQSEYTEDGRLTKGETANLSVRLQKLQQLYGK